MEGIGQYIDRIARDKTLQQLREQKANKENIAAGFTRIGFGKDKKPVDLKERCFWVPASVNHQVDGIYRSGAARHSFFVYGGVSIQPRITVGQGGGGPLGGSPVGGGSFNRGEITRVFQNHHIISPTNTLTQNHRLLQLAGFTNLNAQSNRIYLPTHESQHPTRSIHSGRHTDTAMGQVASAMNKIVEKGQAENWSQSQYRAGLRTMLSEQRQDLREENIALNAKARPWAK